MPTPSDESYSNLMLAIGLVAGALRVPETKTRLRSELLDGTFKPYILKLVRDGLSEVLRPAAEHT